MIRQQLISRSGLSSGMLIRGEQADPAAPLLVCIHGGGCNANYFDLKGFSIVGPAVERGFHLLLVNRPGYAGLPAIEDEHPIQATAAVIRAFVDEVRADYLRGCEDVVIIGHSIGGAVALTMASARGDWPLRGIAVSGIGDAPAPEVIAWSALLRAGVYLPEEQASSYFLGPEGTYSWQAPVSIRRAAEPWRMAEILYIVEKWPKRWPAVAGAIEIPVHLRLAEHEKIWETGPPVVARMAEQLQRSVHVDADLLGEGGHLYEIHKRGSELITSQLDFLRSAGGVLSTRDSSSAKSKWPL